MQLLVAFLWISWFSRLDILWTKGLRAEDVLGFLDDGFFSILLTFLFSSLFRLKVLNLLGLTLVGIFHRAQGEHILENGHFILWSFFKFWKDRTFFSGSMWSSFFHIKTFFLLFPPWLLTLRKSKKWISQWLWLALIPAAFWPYVSWRHISPVRNVFVSWMGSNSESLAQGTFSQEFFSQDLQGDLRWPTIQRPKNVLLILVEGLQGRLFDAQNPERGQWTPFLQRLAKENLFYSHVVGVQRQTLRGQWSILTGLYPNILSPEMKADLFLRGEAPLKVSCLPHWLGEQGYKTLYAQGAPLSFMGKNRFMPACGFQESWGGEELSPDSALTGWGLDDKTFYEKTLKILENLKASSQPWFLKLLNVGTHHPYNLTPGWAPKGFTPMGESFAFFDKVLENFLHSLEKMGILQDTLVIITGDEANGSYHKDFFAEAFSHQDLPLIVMGPQPQWPSSEKITDLYSQSDLALSLADALNLPSPPFPGRSLFRKYRQPRPVLFGNVYLDTYGAVWTPNRMTLCSRRENFCQNVLGRWPLGPFQSERISCDEKKQLENILAWNEWHSSEEKRSILLMEPGTYTYTPKNAWEKIWGVSLMGLTPPYEARTKIHGKILKGMMKIRHTLMEHTKNFVVFSWEETLLPGAELEHDFLETAHPWGQDYEFFTNIFPLEEVTLEIKEARFFWKPDVKSPRPKTTYPQLPHGSIEGLKNFSLNPCFQAMDRCPRHQETTLAYGHYLSLPAGTKLNFSGTFSANSRSKRAEARLVLSQNGSGEVLIATPWISVAQQPGLELSHELIKASPNLEAQVLTRGIWGAKDKLLDVQLTIS